MQGEKKLWINPNLNLTGSNIFNCFVWWLYCLHWGASKQPMSRPMQVTALNLKGRYSRKDLYVTYKLRALINIADYNS